MTEQEMDENIKSSIDELKVVRDFELEWEESSKIINKAIELFRVILVDIDNEFYGKN